MFVPMSSPQEIEDRAAVARPMIERILGQPVGAMLHQPFGHGNIVFKLPDLDSPLVAKTSDRAEAFLHTAANLSTLQELGIPVPNWVGRDDDGQLAVIVLEWIEGEDLAYALPEMTFEQRRTLAYQIADIQRRVGTLPDGGGFGWVPIGERGPFGSWFEIVDRDLHRLSARFVARLEPALSELRDRLRQIPPTPFLDDVTVKNVIVRDGCLNGIVDLDWICYGDPLYWLALTETTVMLDVGETGMDYCDELRRLWFDGAESPRELFLYEAMFAASFLERELPPDQHHRMRGFFEFRLTDT